MLIEITDHAVIAYQQACLKEEAAGKTINEEVGELVRIMGQFRRNRPAEAKTGEEAEVSGASGRWTGVDG